jgi:hypothetical protein
MVSFFSRKGAVYAASLIRLFPAAPVFLWADWAERPV